MGPPADWVVLKSGAGEWYDEPVFENYMGAIELESGDCNGNGYPDAAQIGLNPSLDWNGDEILDACVPANYCVATANSTGLAAQVIALGSPEVHRRDFVLGVRNLPLNEVGYFLMSGSTDFVQGFGGSLGNLCLGTPLASAFDQVIPGTSNTGSATSMARYPRTQAMASRSCFVDRVTGEAPWPNLPPERKSA